MSTLILSGILAQNRSLLAARALMHRHRRWFLTAFGLCMAAAAWLRLPPVARDTLWAEDGRNFLQIALTGNPLDSLFTPYAGYLHFTPRLIAAGVVQFVPVAGYALAMTAGACLCAGLIAAVVLVCSRDVIAWMPARLVVASITVCDPLAAREVLGNTANLHSLFFWGMFWTLLHRPRTRAGGVAMSVFLLAGALTDIQSLLLLPLLLWKVRDSARWLPRAAFLLGAAAQLLVTLFWPRQAAGPPVDIGSIAYGYLINSVVTVWVPQQMVGPLVASGGPLLCLLMAAPFAVATAVIMHRGSAVQRMSAGALLGLSMLVYALSVLENPNSLYDYATLSTAELRSLWLTRYGVVPSMALLALVVLAAAALRTARERTSGPVRRWVPLPAIALIAVSASLTALFVPAWTRRSNGPEWAPQVAAAQYGCQRSPDDRRMALSETIGWHVTLTCRQLEGPTSTTSSRP
jgi:hypothetical protein